MTDTYCRAAARVYSTQIVGFSTSRKDKHPARCLVVVAATKKPYGLVGYADVLKNGHEMDHRSKLTHVYYN
jgi:hypothetical protein